MAGLYAITTALVQRLKRTHFGYPVNSDKLSDGELHDPGVQDFADEFLAGLKQQDPITMPDTLELVAPQNGPAIKIFRKRFSTTNINELIQYVDESNNTYNTVTEQITNVNNVNNITEETINNITNVTENITNITNILGSGTSGSIDVVTGVSGSVSVSGCTATVTLTLTTRTITFTNGVASF